MAEQPAMPVNSTASVVMGVSSVDLCLRQNFPSEKVVCTAGASAAATAAHDEEYLRAREEPLSIGISPAELEAEIQARLPATGAAVVQCPLAPSDH